MNAIRISKLELTVVLKIRIICMSSCCVSVENDQCHP